jgi:hypothetical protein
MPTVGLTTGNPIQEERPRLAAVLALPAVTGVGQARPVVQRAPGLHAERTRGPDVVEFHWVLRTGGDDVGREVGPDADATMVVPLEDGRSDVAGPLGALGGVERGVAPESGHPHHAQSVSSARRVTASPVVTKTPQRVMKP